MPIKPNPGESEQDFVSRCIGFHKSSAEKTAGRSDEVISAMCYSMYRQAKESRDSKGFVQNIHETLPLSEASIIPDVEGKKSHRAWWPLLKAGPGNRASKNWYTEKALETAAPLALSRKKMFFSHHEGDVKPVERDPRDWAASVKETKVENGILFGLVQAYDPWLKERMYEAPDELACSIEGRGKPSGKRMHEGEEWNVIEDVKWINAFCIVDYPGNTPMGISLTERDDQSPDEERYMNVAELKEKNPELYSEIEKEIKEAAKAELDKKIGEKDAEIKKMKDAMTADQKTITDLSESMKKMDAKLDGLEALGKKKDRDQKVAAEMAKLPKEAVTDKFKELVESAKDEKAALELVEERAKLFESKVTGHGKNDNKKPEEALKERHTAFMDALGIKEEKKEDKK